MLILCLKFQVYLGIKYGTDHLVVLFIGFRNTVRCDWIRATGFNQQMIRAQGVDTDITVILGLLLKVMA